MPKKVPIGVACTVLSVEPFGGQCDSSNGTASVVKIRLTNGDIASNIFNKQGPKGFFFRMFFQSFVAP